jgi:hypothetical protein
MKVGDVIKVYDLDMEKYSLGVVCFNEKLQEPFVRYYFRTDVKGDLPETYEVIGEIK